MGNKLCSPAREREREREREMGGRGSGMQVWKVISEIQLRERNEEQVTK